MARQWATDQYQYRAVVEYDSVNNGTHHSTVYGPYAAPGTALAQGNRNAGYLIKSTNYYSNVTVQVERAETKWTAIDSKLEAKKIKLRAAEAKQKAEQDKITAAERLFWAEVNDGAERGTYG